jgi:hypothetical protein
MLLELATRYFLPCYSLLIPLIVQKEKKMSWRSEYTLSCTVQK